MGATTKNPIEHIWHPLKCLGPVNNAAFYSSALIILNQEIRPEMDSKLELLWSNVSLKLCADGGVNRLYQWCQRLGRNPSDYLPDVICGDLDSIDPTIRDFYALYTDRVQFILLSNQDLTDFTKSLRLVVKCIGRGEFDEEIFKTNPDGFTSLRKRSSDTERIDSIYCVGEFSGRVDHSLSNLHTLYDKNLADVQILMIAADSLTFLLKPGSNLIAFHKSQPIHLIGKHCGLIPLGEAVRTRTSGLKWNLNGDVDLTFASFISSSNEFENPFDLSKIVELCRLPEPYLNQAEESLAKCVFVEVNKPLLFTMSLN